MWKVRFLFLRLMSLFLLRGSELWQTPDYTRKSCICWICYIALKVHWASVKEKVSSPLFWLYLVFLLCFPLRVLRSIYLLNFYDAFLRAFYIWNRLCPLIVKHLQLHLSRPSNPQGSHGYPERVFGRGNMGWMKANKLKQSILPRGRFYWWDLIQF